MTDINNCNKLAEGGLKYFDLQPGSGDQIVKGTVVKVCALLATYTGVPPLPLPAPFRPSAPVCSTAEAAIAGAL